MKTKLLFILALLCFAKTALAQTFSGNAGSDVFVNPPFRLCVGQDDGTNACFVRSGPSVVKLTGQLDFTFVPRTVGSLPAASINAGRVYRVTDGQTTADCTAGGGSSNTVCMSNGSTWQTLGSGGGGGGGPVKLSDLFSATVTSSLSNGLNQITWNWGALTGSNTGFLVGETAAATGSSNILHRVTTLAGSTAIPFQADVAGNGVNLSVSGIWQKVGTGGIDYGSLANFPSACGANQFSTQISVNPGCLQPAFSNLSGTATTAQIPNPAGDVTNTYAATQVTGVHFGANGFSLGTGPSVGQCIGLPSGTTLAGVSCSGVPASPGLAVQVANSGATAFDSVAVPTTPNTVPQFFTSTPAGGVGVKPVFGLAGIPINAQSGTTYTIAVTDRTTVIKAVNASAQTYTATNPSTAGFGSNFPYLILNQGTGTITENSSGFNINGATSLLIPPNWNAWHWSDNTNYFALRVPDYSVFPNCGANCAINFNTSTGAFGTVTNIPTISGSLTNGNCVKALGATTIADSGSACGGGGSGTVTSVAQTMPVQFGVAGSPITTSGTLADTWANPNTAQNIDVFAPFVGWPNSRVTRSVMALGSGAFNNMGDSSSEVGNSTCSGGATAPTATAPVMCPEGSGATGTATGVSAGGTAGTTQQIHRTGRTHGIMHQMAGSVNTTSLVRMFRGLTDQALATTVASDVPSGNFVGFMASNTGTYTGLTDTTHYVCVTKDGTTENAVATTVAFDTSFHYFALWEDVGNSKWHFYLDNAEVCGTGLTSNLPTSGTNLRYADAIINTSGTANIIINTAWVVTQEDK